MQVLSQLIAISSLIDNTCVKYISIFNDNSVKAVDEIELSEFPYSSYYLITQYNYTEITLNNWSILFDASTYEVVISHRLFNEDTRISSEKKATFNLTDEEIENIKIAIEQMK